MKTTLSVLKADIGSIGGHICPSKALIDRVREYVQKNSKEWSSTLISAIR